MSGPKARTAGSSLCAESTPDVAGQRGPSGWLAEACGSPMHAQALRDRGPRSQMAEVRAVLCST